MKKRLVFIISLVAFLGLFQSCDMIYDIATSIVDPNGNISGGNGNGNTDSGSGDNDNQENIPQSEIDKIKSKVVDRARYYVRQSTIYQESATGNRAIPFDCSGLVYKCYEEALIGSNYRASYTVRPTAITLQNDYSTPTNNPKPGDLVFFNFLGGKTNHVGIVVSLKNDRLTWIDASDYKEYSKVVDERTRSLSELKAQNKFKGFGKMDLIRK